MKNQQNFKQFNQYQISSTVLTKIYGGEKKGTVKADPEIE
jgi:hypothetical protein